ncbi:hypothetical protein H1235_05545 [Pseudoxanthomonas sp. NC8]|nr:hypothetical protein H1235_05545 [Pseudoxanthomonas sp. NC8]
MRTRFALLALLAASGTLRAMEAEAASPEIVRHTIDGWERDIGYSGVVGWRHAVPVRRALRRRGHGCGGGAVLPPPDHDPAALRRRQQPGRARNHLHHRHRRTGQGDSGAQDVLRGRALSGRDLGGGAPPIQPGFLLEVEWTVRLRQPH